MPAGSAHKAQPNVRAGARGRRHSRLTPTPSPPCLPQLLVKWTETTSHRVLPTSSGPLEGGHCGLPNFASLKSRSPLLEQKMLAELRYFSPTSLMGEEDREPQKPELSCGRHRKAVFGVSFCFWCSREEVPAAAPGSAYLQTAFENKE